MAIRLAKAFGSAPEVWAGLQFDYDMAQAMKHEKDIKVRRVPQPGRPASNAPCSILGLVRLSQAARGFHVERYSWRELKELYDPLTPRWRSPPALHYERKRPLRAGDNAGCARGNRTRIRNIRLAILLY